MNTQTLVDLLQTLVPSTPFYTGSINKANPKCVGVYARGSAGANLAIGGVTNTSYNKKSYTILVHWGEDTTVCETKSQAIYDALYGKSNLNQGGVHIVSIEMLDSSPVDIKRDENNICEMAIRVIITHERS